MSKVGQYCFANVRFNYANKTLSASINHLAPPQISFLVRDPGCQLTTHDILTKFSIKQQDRELYSGNAVVQHVFFNGLFTLVTAVLTEHWQADCPKLTNVSVENSLQGFLSICDQPNKTIESDYRLVVSHIKSFLQILHAWVYELEETYCNDYQQHSDVKSTRQLNILQLINASIQLKLIQAFQPFERIAANISEENLAVHAQFARQELHPMILAAPFTYHTYTKPNGYALDTETMNMLTGKTCHSKTVFSTIIHNYFIEQTLGLAYKNRITWFFERLNSHLNTQQITDRPFRILCVGCGPALEIQRLIKSNPAVSNCEFHLVDHDQTMLDNTKKELAKLIGETGHLPNISFNCQSILQLIKQAEETDSQSCGEYDIIICPNLLDYLSDQIGFALIKLFYYWLSSSGKLLIANTHPKNPYRYQMSHLLDWHLQYRDEAAFNALCKDLGSIEISHDETGVMLFLEMKKDLKLEKINVNLTKNRSALNVV